MAQQTPLLAALPSRADQYEGRCLKASLVTQLTATNGTQGKDWCNINVIEKEDNIAH